MPVAESWVARSGGVEGFEGFAAEGEDYAEAGET